MNVKKYVIVFSLMFFAEKSFGQNTLPPSGNVGIGTTSPRGQFDVAGTGDIFLSNNPIAGTGQSIYLPGHIFLAPYNGSDWTYLQARRFDNSGSTNLMIRTWNAGALTDAMSITSGGSVGIGTASPQQKFHIKSGALMSSSASFDNINLRADGTNVPALKFTRWVGSGSVQHNAFVGQFYNPSAGNEYSFGIGTAVSSSGDQDINNKVLTVTLNGNVGIGTTAPGAKLDVGAFIPNGALGSVLGRLQEGNSTGVGTFLGVRGYDTQPTNVKSFAKEHSFYGTINSSVNFFRGGGMTGGFLTFNTDANTEQVRITNTGNVGIGITNPTQKLQVKGTVYSTEVKVDLAAGTGPDYVFEPTYDLKSLSEIETYIKENKHLPEVPSAKEMEKNGVQLGEMNMLLLKKVEELTLYSIEQNKKLNEQQELIQGLIKEMQQLKTDTKKTKN